MSNRATMRLVPSVPKLATSKGLVGHRPLASGQRPRSFLTMLTSADWMSYVVSPSSG